MLTYDEFKHFMQVPTSSISRDEEQQIKDYRAAVADGQVVELKSNAELLEEIDLLLQEIGIARAEDAAYKESDVDWDDSEHSVWDHIKLITPEELDELYANDDDEEYWKR